MNHTDAVEWFRNKRSMTNMIPQDPFDTWILRIEQADAAKLEQAYIVLKAHKEHLLDSDNVAVKFRDVEFRALLDLFMCSNPWPTGDEESQNTIENMLDEEASKRGFDKWVTAYHNFTPEV